MDEPYELNKLDDYVLCHTTSSFAYEKIYKEGVFKSTEAQYGKGMIEGINMGGDPSKIYFQLTPAEEALEFYTESWHKYEATFVLDAKILLPYIDHIEFSIGWNYGKKGKPYQRFEGKPLKGFEDLWPNNPEEELLLNFKHFYASMESEESRFFNEVTVQVNEIPFRDPHYLIDVIKPAPFPDFKNYLTLYKV